MPQATLTNTRDLLLMEEGSEPRPARRGFLRTLITAPAAALATHRLLIAPSAPIITTADAEQRLKRGLAEVEQAFRDLFPGIPVSVRGNCLDGHHDYYAEMFRTRPAQTVSYATAIVMAGPGLTDGRA